MADDSAGLSREHSKLLMANSSAPGVWGWHGKSDIFSMIPLLFIFFLIGTLMCAMIVFDPHHDNEFAPRHRRGRSKKFTQRATSKVELPHYDEVESHHTALGSAHRQ